MTEPDGLRAAVSAGVLPSEDMHRALLKSIVEVARAIFCARAASIFLLDEETDELVFEAVAGEERRASRRPALPVGQGVAGWVLVTRQPLVIEDVTQDPRFAKEVAESTGYVPKGLMAVPLLHEEDALGVLEVLDRPERPGSRWWRWTCWRCSRTRPRSRSTCSGARGARNAALEATGGEAAVVARLAEAVDSLEGERREAALRLVAALDAILRTTEAGA